MLGCRNKLPIYIVCVLIFLVYFFGQILNASEQPPEEAKYKKYFVHYVDKRSLTEKALNLIGLTSEETGRSFALIAGVSSYPNMSMPYRNLKPASEDIRKLQEYLKIYEFFDEIVVLENGDMTIGNLKHFLQGYFSKRIKKFPKSRFLFAYSGHGMCEGSKGYLLECTARDLKDKDHSVCTSTLKTLIEEVIDSGHYVLALLNACYSGTFLRRTYGDGPNHFIPSHRGAHAITAGGTDELTWHNPEIGTGSIFFEKLFAGCGGQADLYPKPTGDGVITVNELYIYLSNEIQIFSDQYQNPQLGDISKDGSKGSFFFLNRDHQIAEGTVPEFKSEKITVSDLISKQLLIEGKKYYSSAKYSDALPFLEKAAGTQNAEAMTYLGYMHENGQGVVINPVKAAEWYQMGARYKNIDAMYSLGRMQYEGIGVPINYVESSKWFHKAAEGGYVPAMTCLGKMYLWGVGVEKDHAKAANWISAAAKAGHVSAMTQLGYMYEEGRGVSKDKYKAVHLYQKAASLGDKSAEIYLKKLGVPKQLPSERNPVIKKVPEQPPQEGSPVIETVPEQRN